MTPNQISELSPKSTGADPKRPDNAPRPGRCVRLAGAPRCAACLGRPLRIAVVAGTDFPNGASHRSFKQQARCWTWQFFESDGEALDHVLHGSPDVLVLSTALRDTCSLRSPRQLSARLPKLLVLMLARAPDKPAILRALQHGATGFLELPVSPGELACGVRDLARDRTVLCAIARGAMVEFFQDMGRAARLLAPRERQVMKSLADGLCEAEVGQRLNIQTSTVHTLVGRIYEKWHVHTRPEALDVFHRLP